MVKKAKSWDYVFAVGRIRALERSLIGQEVFQEAVDLALPEALKLFAEADISAEELLRVNDSRQLEKALSRKLSELKKLIKDLLLDKDLECLLELDNLTLAKKSVQEIKSEFLSDYIMHFIDMHNIKTFLRLHVLKQPQGSFKACLNEEGFIQKRFFIKNYAEDLSPFLSGLRYVHKRAELVDYAYFLEEPMIMLKSRNSFIGLEKAMHDFLIRILRPARYLSFGPEPLLAYYFTKVNEINLMRMIILAKLNNFGADTVKERLNLIYA
jgi:V/A-type H+-transporting ATPase subunit C